MKVRKLLLLVGDLIPRLLMLVGESILNVIVAVAEPSFSVILSLEKIGETAMRVAARLRRRVQVAPGVHIARVLQWIFSKKTYDRVFDPQIADLQWEYFKALKENRPIKPTWVRVRAFLKLVVTIIIALPPDALRAIVKVWRVG
jgi:hypothetical protein